MFADDTALVYYSENELDFENIINEELCTFKKWLDINKSIIINDKTVYMRFSGNKRIQILFHININKNCFEEGIFIRVFRIDYK